MIPQRNISLIANKLLKEGGKRVPESVIERDYVLAWFLTGLANHPLREILVFKGGTALRRCWIDHYRFSEDLDFTLTKPIQFSEILVGLNEVFESVYRECGISGNAARGGEGVDPMVRFKLRRLSSQNSFALCISGRTRICCSHKYLTHCSKDSSCGTY